MPIDVHLPAVLRSHTGGQALVGAGGATVGEALDDLVGRYPSLGAQLRGDTGELHRFLIVYLNDDDVRYLEGLDTKVEEGDRMTILQAVAGGAGESRQAVAGGAGESRQAVAEVAEIAEGPGGPGGAAAPGVGAQGNGAPEEVGVGRTYASILDLIGNTPLVDVSAVSPNPGARILVKLEGQNPGGSVKDRAALAMVEAAEKDGRLRPGQTLIESSSGNTGIGLALVCRVKGYRLKIVLPTNVSPERRQLLEVWGAEIIDSPGAEGSTGAVRMALALAAEHPEWAFLYQYGNAANPQAHYEGTGPEIWRDCPEVTHFVAGLGTSGTLLGVGRYLKERNPALQVWAVEPPAGEMVDGLRSLDEGYIPPIFTDLGGAELLDRKTVVRAKESVIWTKKLAELGIFAGISTGAALYGAIRCADAIDEGVIVLISADGGWKYLSSGVWTEGLDTVVERAEHTLYF